jgi:hypothetical protein
MVQALLWKADGYIVGKKNYLCLLNTKFEYGVHKRPTLNVTLPSSLLFMHPLLILILPSRLHPV